MGYRGDLNIYTILWSSSASSSVGSVVQRSLEFGLSSFRNIYSTSFWYLLDVDSTEGTCNSCLMSSLHFLLTSWKHALEKCISATSVLCCCQDKVQLCDPYEIYSQCKDFRNVFISEYFLKVSVVLSHSKVEIHTLASVPQLLVQL